MTKELCRVNTGKYFYSYFFSLSLSHTHTHTHTHNNMNYKKYKAGKNSQLSFTTSTIKVYSNSTEYVRHGYPAYLMIY